MLAIAVLPAILIALGVLIVLLFIGGWIASERRNKVLRERLLEEIRAADAALAQARSSDRGWDRAVIEAAARDALAQRHAGHAVDELHLVRVVDQPGTDADQAIMHARFADGHEESVTLGRREGAWHAL